MYAAAVHLHTRRAVLVLRLISPEERWIGAYPIILFQENIFIGDGPLSNIAIPRWRQYSRSLVRNDAECASKKTTSALYISVGISGGREAIFNYAFASTAIGPQ
ncbi:hypothetical protein NDU88_005041 [Pleurodeles waltl]|uniref:Uncharacterized protein n=1 Tax=Pleurodeles waltl TaxID=8319 RepID=A0AAV7KZN2_PLEWA|nr:hypothetical protein NDU88_005041 [Pleurodeles waltl]